MLPFITCSHCFGMEIWQTVDGAEHSRIHCKRRSNRSKSFMYSITVQTGSQLMKWNANAQFVYANEEQDAILEPCQTPELSLDVTLELWCGTKCVCVCVYIYIYACVCVRTCTHECARVIDSPTLNPLCCFCCSLFCLLLFIMNCCSQLVCDSLWKLPGPFFMNVLWSKSEETLLSVFRHRAVM